MTIQTGSMPMRNKIETMSDRLLLLYTIARGNEYGFIEGPFKLMKIPFLAELESTRSGVNTFNYRFYRYTYGPMTTEVYEDRDSLGGLGLVTGKREVRLTDKGEKLIAIASELFDENREVCR